MLRVEIEDAAVVTKSGTSARTGRPYNIREQSGWVYLVDPKTGTESRHPTKITFGLEDGVEAYAVGTYTLHPSSLYVGRFGGLEIGRIRLLRRSQQAPANPVRAVG